MNQNKRRFLNIQKKIKEEKSILSKSVIIADLNIKESHVRTSLGFRGYSILKEDISEKEMEIIRKKLMIKPSNMGGGSTAVVVEYPVYRESTTKLYVPRYFGEEIYGVAKECLLMSGEPIDDSVIFEGTLRPEQVAPINAYLSRVNANEMGGGGLLELPCAYGKTTISLYIISKIRRKTLVIVHKEFLLNQWVERIKQFLPFAKIGRIQGNIVDVEDKDIVIGMLQSISMREYSTELFRMFGFTIFDEVHHISSEVFSCALFKLVTKYMLGLSATMERKDGTTFVFKHFLGEVAYKGENKEQHAVEVRAMEFSVDDPIFNQTETNYRGEPQFSRMITKLCDYMPRCEFIVRIVKNLLIEFPKKQMLILAHNRSLIKFLYSKLGEECDSVGLYIGGMKQAQLDASSEKLILIGSYSMASEGLDIKTLSTLVLTTPKTDIIQVVGRILRSRHETPLIIDIIDKQDLFKNQWQKRKAYYRKCNYFIKQTNNEGINWKTAFIPKKSLSTKHELENKPNKNNNNCHENDTDNEDNNCHENVTDNEDNNIYNNEYEDNTIYNGKCMILPESI